MELVFERYGSDMENWIRLWSLDQWISFLKKKKKKLNISDFGRMDFERNRSDFGRMDLDFGTTNLLL